MPDAMPSSSYADLIPLLMARLDEMAAPVTPEGLDASTAAAFIGVSRSKFHEMNAAGQVPAPVELGDRCPRWLRSELVAWLRAGAPPRVRWLLVRDANLKRMTG